MHFYTYVGAQIKAPVWVQKLVDRCSHGRQGHTNFSPKYLENPLSKNQTKACDESTTIHTHTDCYHEGKWNAAQHL